MKPSPIKIHVNSQGDGYVFGLHPLSEIWIAENYPTKARVPVVFIGSDQRQDDPPLHPSIIEQVLKLLTGLSLDELNQIGGFSLYNPKTQQEMTDLLAAYV